MNEMAPRGAEAFLRRYEGLRDSLPGDRAVRAAAAELLRRHGLPGVRDEAFKYTNLRAVADTAWQEPLVPVSGFGEAETALPGAAMVFQDGRFQAELSRLPLAFSARLLRDAPELAPAGEQDALGALNLLLAEDGAVLDLPEGVDGGTILLESRGSSPGRPASFHPRHRVRLRAGASLTLVDVNRGEGG